MSFKKINTGWFTYVEVIMSLLIAILIGFGIFSMNDFLLNNDTKNRKDAMLANLSQYIYDIVDFVPVPEDYMIVFWQKFYITHFSDLTGENDDAFVYNNNPVFKAKDFGFFNASFDEKTDFSHEIIFIGTGALTDSYGVQNIVHHFIIHITYAGKENTFYITK